MRPVAPLTMIPIVWVAIAKGPAVLEGEGSCVSIAFSGEVAFRFATQVGFSRLGPRIQVDLG